MPRFLLLLLLALALAGCPTTSVDDDDSVADDDDLVGDDDDSVADDDDSVGDDDDSVADDDDSVGDDDDSVSDDDDSVGDDDDSVGDDDDSVGDDDDSASAPDADGDGVSADTDCDDADPANYPGNTEVCDGGDNDCDPSSWATDEDVDIDADGVAACLDCDDGDGANYPGNTEVCDGGDNDCDVATWATDEDTDVDNDGAVTCLDCDDADGANYPGNTEVCDGADNDCDSGTFAADEDADGDSDGAPACLDCDDGDANNYPGNTEVCDAADNDCDPTTWATDEDTDVDNDGAVTCLDCDDANVDNTPGGIEVCDGADNDCDAATVFAGEDTDGDGDGAVTCLDCDDGDALNFPGNTEACDAADNDCDATTFADAAGEVDGDSDGSLSCVDCDDADGANFPGNAEVCDGADNDCDGTFDASVEFRTTFTVTTFGGPDWIRGGRFLATEDAVLHTVDYYLGGLPGDVVTWLVYEGTSETDVGTYSLVAQATTTLINSAAEWKSSTPVDLPLTAGNYYIFAAHYDVPVTVGGETNYPWPEVAGPLTYQAGVFMNSVTTPPTTGTGLAFNPTNADAIGFTLVGEGDVDGDLFLGCEDCNDTDASVYPGQTETCDGVDEDCDPTTSAAGGEDDVDMDGSISCFDCNDGDGDSYPGAPELCDGADNNCDAAVADVFTPPSSPSVGPAGADRLRGNIILVTQDTLLTSFRHYLNVPTGTALEWGLYEGTSVLGGFDLVASNVTEVSGLVGGSATWHESGAFGYSMEAGMYYAFVTWWAPSSGYDWDMPTFPLMAGSWGSVEGSMVLTGTGGLPATASTANADNLYFVEVVVNDEGDGDSDTWLACEDCDDAEVLMAPDGVEDCDELDNDCSGAIDLFASSGSNSTPATPDTTNNWVVSRTIEISETAPIADVNVIVDIAHTNTDDLSITLTSPFGTVVDLSTNNGGSGADYQVTTFDDEASTPITAGAAPFSGAYAPEEPLAAFDGELSAGTWTLTVVDDFPSSDDGTLNSWSLDVTMDGGACTSASCLEELTANSNAADGTYVLNPMGVQGSAGEWVCDMTNGGWTQVFYNDFDTVGPDALWSQQTTYDCAGDLILGGYNVIAAGTQTFLLDVSMHTHTEARVQTEYWAVDSWDGETAWIDVDGTNIWFTTVTNGALGNPNLCGAGNGGWTEDIFSIDQAFAHSGGTLFYSAGSDLDQPSGDESFAVDDVIVWVR